jgi:hypothetical protein
MIASSGTQTANVLYSSGVQNITLATTTGTQTVNAIQTSSSQTANVLFSAQAQVVDAIKTSTTQTSNVLYSGGAQTARLLNTASTQTANVMTAAGNQDANVLITTGGTQTANVLHGSGNQTLRLATTGGTQTATVLTASGTQDTNVLITSGGTQTANLLNHTGGGTQNITMLNSSGGQTINMATTSTASSTYNMMTGVTSTGNTKTINFGTGSTAGTTDINIGGIIGTVTINNPTVVGTQTTQNLWNTVATTVNAWGAATGGINIGSAAGGILTVRSPTAIIASGATGQVSVGGDNNGAIEIGRAGRATAGTPFIDFHSSTSGSDFDVRLIASGGTAAGGDGTLDINAALTRVNGTLNVTTITGLTSINPDGDGISSSYSDQNPTINGVTFGGGWQWGADGGLNSGWTQSRALNALNGFVNSTNGYYVGTHDFTADSAAHTTTQIIDGAGRVFSPHVQTPLLTTGAAGTAGTITGQWTLSAGSRFQATYADLAERYKSDDDYEPGTVLMIGGEAEVTVATLKGKHRLAGIVSTNPAYVLNAMEQGSVIIGLAGRVPCFVIGKIEKGDMLTISAIPGVATSTEEPIAVIGRALENYDSGEVGMIEVMIGRA